MISEEEARRKILSALSPLPMESLALVDALDRFAAKDFFATTPLPAFDNSAMDGYAVRAADAKPGALLKIIGEQPAGISRALQVSVGEAVRIFTGAPLPAGADAIVMQEEAERSGELVIINTKDVAYGDFVRPAGADLAVGQEVVKRGQRLRAATLSLLASQGIDSADVHGRARVAIVTTGDEIVAAGAALRPGEIYETNGLMLSALTVKTGAEVTMRMHNRDDLETLCANLRRASESDVVVVSGGVSVGERDLVVEALRKIGAQIELWRVKIKPGKPFLFGRKDHCAVFGLPGNPVSSFVTFLIFVRPALLRLMGADDSEFSMPRALGRLAQAVTGDEDRPHYFRGKLADALFTLFGRQESHALFGLARANALLRLNAGENRSAGDIVEVLLMD